jgi:peroxiredoxin
MSDTIPLYGGLAQAFRMEDVDTIFVLTGDGNMHWEAALSENEEVRAIHVWHDPPCHVWTAPRMQEEK